MASIKEAATAELSLRRLRGESITVIADEIEKISIAMKKLLANSRLSEDTLLLLIQDAIPTERKNANRMLTKDIKAVLDGIEALEMRHIKYQEKKK